MIATTIYGMQTANIEFRKWDEDENRTVPQWAKDQILKDMADGYEFGRFPVPEENNLFLSWQKIGK